MMVASVYSLAHPVRSFAKIWWANAGLVPTISRPQGVAQSKLEQLIAEAQQQYTQKRFVTMQHRYRAYQDGLCEHLSSLRDREIIFLDLVNLTLEDRFGRFSREGTDDFGSHTCFVPALLGLYEQMPEAGKAYLRDIVFWRMGPYDFPFTIMDGQTIKNPFSKQASMVSAQLVAAQKQPLGSWERHIDAPSGANYRFSSVIFSAKAFRRQAKEPGYLELLAGDLATIEDKAVVAIACNRQILKQKYAKIGEQLDVQEITAYMLQGSLGMGLLRGIKGLAPIGEKLLWNTKNLQGRGELELAALNLLSGRVTARCRLPPVIIKKSNLQVTAVPESVLYPYLRLLGDVESTEQEVAKTPNLALLEKDIQNFRFSVASIETMLVRLNYGNYRVHVQQGTTEWQKVLAQRMLHPVDLASYATDPNQTRLVRPSNTGALCEFHKYLHLLPLEFFPPITEQNSALAGTALHYVSNEVVSDEWKELARYGIKSMQRRRYCEVPLGHTFFPDVDDWQRACGYLAAKQKADGLYEQVLGFLESREPEPIYYHCKPDAVTLLGRDPVIIDFKRRAASVYPVKYFFEQGLRYALAVADNLNLEPERYHIVIVQTPFAANRLLGNDAPETGVYRNQRPIIATIGADDVFMQDTRRNIVLEWAQNSVFEQDIQKGFLARELYQMSKGKPRCSDCFVNREGSFQCNYALTGRWESWEDT